MTPHETVPHPRWQTYCEERNFRFFTLDFHDDLFRQVLEVRSSVYAVSTAVLPDAIDAYSEHYLCQCNGRPIAALRVTRASSGRLDCEEYFPSVLLENLRNAIGSATRFVALPEVQSCTKIAQLMVEIAWKDQVDRDIRLDVINVHERAIKYYGRLGYELVADSFFVHPTWGTPSYVMLFPAHPTRPSPIQAVFENIDQPLELASIKELVPLRDWRLPANATYFQNRNSSVSI